MNTTYIVGIIIAVLVVGYSLISGRKIKKVHGPGGVGVEFSDAKKAPDQSLAFPIYYEINPQNKESGFAEVFIGGEKKGTLAVNESQPRQTLSVKVPRPGNYHYRIEFKETEYFFREPDFVTRHPEVVTLDGKGTIDVQSGVAYSIGIERVFLGKGLMHEVYMKRDLSKEEERQKEIEENIDLQDFENQLKNEDRGKESD